MTSERAPRTVVLVEGPSDRRAVETLAVRLGRDLFAARVEVMAMGGATNVGRCLLQVGPRGLDLRVAGLYDAPAERFVRRGLERAGVGAVTSRADLESLGFFACVDDLEEELIRSLGVAAVLEVVARHGDLASFQIMRRQPAHRDRTDEQRLRRFLGTTSGRKVAYAGHLVEALDLAALPRPLDLLMRGLSVH